MSLVLLPAICVALTPRLPFMSLHLGSGDCFGESHAFLPPSLRPLLRLPGLLGYALALFRAVRGTRCQPHTAKLLRLTPKALRNLASVSHSRRFKEERGLNICAPLLRFISTHEVNFFVSSSPPILHLLLWEDFTENPSDFWIPSLP